MKASDILLYLFLSVFALFFTALAIWSVDMGVYMVTRNHYQGSVQGVSQSEAQTIASVARSKDELPLGKVITPPRITTNYDGTYSVAYDFYSSQAIDGFVLDNGNDRRNAIWMLIPAGLSGLFGVVLWRELFKEVHDDMSGVISEAG